MTHTDAVAPAPPLLATKLHPPRRSRTLVARPRLSQLAHRSLHRALTLVSAPAWFGKTTLVAGWFADDRAVAWVSLDSRDDDPQRFWSYVVASLERAAPGLASNAPAEIADAATVMTAAVTSVLDSGGQDFSALETPEFATAQAEVDPYVFENCEFDSAVEVTGVDFGFTGLPETLDDGRVAILFTNEGAEAHEIIVMRRNDGVTDSFEELLALPEDQAMAKVTPAGGAFAPTTGAPHLAHGMQQEFTVS
ncbi:MAG: hypothetical protein JJE52_10540 [Acidimicrobiia bacterium]|nr:hypothetical protein [Acidimicrobiia bacterium]